MPNTIDLRDFNKIKLLEALKQNESGTRNSLSYETGLSVATCGNLLSELIDGGVVLEIQAAGSTGGRPSRQFVFNSEHSCILTLFPRIEGSVQTLNYTVADMLGRVKEQGSPELASIGPQELETLAESLIQRYPEASVMSVGIPGVVRDGIVSSCDFKGFEGINLKERLRAAFGLETVITNDVNAAAFGYYRQHPSSSDSSLVYIYYPEGHSPGAGIIINGKIISGASNFAGEIAWLPGSGRGELAGRISDAVISVTSVINPDKIIISAMFIDAVTAEEIISCVSSGLPAEHIPSIIFEKDFKESYSAGLIQTGLERYSESLKTDIALLQENL